jgi:hypothetical protein
MPAIDSIARKLTKASSLAMTISIYSKSLKQGVFWAHLASCEDKLRI